MLDEHVQQRFDLSDHFTAQLAHGGSQTSHQYLDQLSDRMHARVNDLINSRRTQISEARTQDPQGRVHWQDTHGLLTLSPDSIWLGGQLSTPQEQLAFSELDQIGFAEHYTNPFGPWQQYDVPRTFSSASPEPSGRAFFPHFDVPEVYRKSGILSDERSPPAISA